MSRSAGLHLLGDDAAAPGRSARSSRTSSSAREENRRRAAAQGRRARRAGRAELCASPAPSTAHPTVPIARLSAARRQRHPGGEGRSRRRWSGIAKRFPVGLRYDIPFDTTRFVEVSIEEVAITFAEAITLVVLVVFLFLQSVRAMIIPVIAMPVSIIGTFAGMFVLGFSINLLTLFGLVLAIGIVVDDAIVVLENVERIMSTEGKRAARSRHPGDAGGDRARSSPSCWCCARCSSRCRSSAAWRASSTGSSPSPSRSRS